LQQSDRKYFIMSFNYISTLMLSSPLRTSIVSGESALTRASKEATTGRFADIGLELGATTGRDVALRADLSFADHIVDTNGLVSGRLEVTQNRMGDMISTAQDFLKQMIAARDGDNGPNIIQPDAAANLQDLIGSLNASYNGSSVFGGLKTQTPPARELCSRLDEQGCDRRGLPDVLRLFAGFPCCEWHHPGPDDDFPEYQSGRRVRFYYSSGRTGSLEYQLVKGDRSGLEQPHLHVGSCR
jgi:Bacterial flagellin N-terminal helical region